jgi:hypothetical protein
MNSVDFMDRLIEEAALKHTRELFLSLPDPKSIKIGKPLSGTKIGEKYRKNGCV